MDRKRKSSHFNDERKEAEEKYHIKYEPIDDDEDDQQAQPARTTSSSSSTSAAAAVGSRPHQRMKLVHTPVTLTIDAPPSNILHLTSNILGDRCKMLDDAPPTTIKRTTSSTSSDPRTPITPNAAPSISMSTSASSTSSLTHPSIPLYSSQPGRNILLNLQACTMNILTPDRLRAKVIDDRVKSIQLSQLKEIRSMHSQNINDLDVDQTEGRYLLSCGGDGLIAVYDVSNELNKRGYQAKPISTRKVQQREFAVSCIQWYPFDTGLFISGSMDGKVAVWDTNTFTCAHTFKLNGLVHTARMSQVATTHSLIATGTINSNVRLCDMNSGAFSHTLIGHSDEILTLDWSPTNEFQLVTGSADKTLRVWDIRRAGALMILDQYNQADPFINTKYINTSEMRAKRDVIAHDNAVTCVKWINEGLNIISSGADKKVRSWDARTGRNSLLNFGGITVNARINRFSVSCNHSSLYFPNGVFLHEYNLATGKLTNKFKGHFERILCCTTNPLTQDVYSGGMDRHILVWTPRSEERSYAPSEDELQEQATAQRRQREAQAELDREAHMRLVQRVLQPNPPPARPIPLVAGANRSTGASSSYQRPDEDAWSDDE